MSEPKKNTRNEDYLKRKSINKSIKNKTRRSDPDDLLYPKEMMSRFIQSCVLKDVLIDTDPEDKKLQLQLFVDLHRLKLQGGRKSYMMEPILGFQEGGTMTSSNLRVISVEESKKLRSERSTRLISESKKLYAEQPSHLPHHIAYKNVGKIINSKRSGFGVDQTDLLPDTGLQLHVDVPHGPFPLPPFLLQFRAEREAQKLHNEMFSKHLSAREYNLNLINSRR